MMSTPSIFVRTTSISSAGVCRSTHCGILTAMLAEAGVPLEAISRRLGHADSKITREVYYHVTEKMKEKENEMIKKVRIC